MAFCETDCEVIWSQIRQREKQLKFKRRWLLGLPTFSSQQKNCDHADILENGYLPESLLREDDVFYDTIKLRVEAAFGARNFERKHHVSQGNVEISDTGKIRKFLLSNIDSFTNKDLHLIARKITGDSLNFEKTRWKMKVIIKKFLAKLVRGHTYDRHQLDIFKQLSQLLGDSRNYQSPLTSLTSRSPSSRVAITQVLDVLWDLPTESLLAMRRKLKGIRNVPEMKCHRHGWARNHLIDLLSRVSKNMLSTLDKGDELPEQFAKAMAVANLSLKLTSGCHNSSIMEFYQFSPKIKTLHDEIAKAIWLVKQKISFRKLEKVKLLLDPGTKISNRSLRTAIRKILIDFLFECSDMDTLPKSLLKALAMINGSSKRKSDKYFVNEEIGKEVEYILGLSAQLKQVYLDLLPFRDFNEDFASAYAEELEESDDNDADSDDDDDGDDSFVQKDSCFHASKSNCLVESMGESSPVFIDDMSMSNGSGVSPLPVDALRFNADLINKVDSGDISTEEALFNISSPFQKFQPPNVPEKMHMHPNADNMDFSMFSPIFGNDGAIETPPKKHSTYKSVSHLDSDINAASTVHSDYPTLSYDATQHIIDEQSVSQNQYLIIQENCDETSMFAYNLIGHMLEEYAKMSGVDVDWNESLYLTGDRTFQDETRVSEGKEAISGVNEDYIIVRVCEKLIPSVCKS